MRYITIMILATTFITNCKTSHPSHGSAVAGSASFDGLDQAHIPGVYELTPGQVADGSVVDFSKITLFHDKTFRSEKNGAISTGTYELGNLFWSGVAPDFSLTKVTLTFDGQTQPVKVIGARQIGDYMIEIADWADYLGKTARNFELTATVKPDATAKAAASLPDAENTDARTDGNGANSSDGDKAAASNADKVSKGGKR